MGINSILETSKNTSISTFEIIAKAKIINNIEFNLNLIKLNVKEDDKNINLILLVNEKLKYSFILDKKTKLIYKSVNNRIISFENFVKDKKDETYFAIAMVLLDNIKNAGKNAVLNSKIENNNLSNPNNSPIGNKLSVLPEGEEGGCERTIMSIRTTESSAISHVNSATATYIEDHPDCKKIYGVDTGCLWGGYGCVATQSIKCTGGGCDIIIGSPEE